MLLTITTTTEHASDLGYLLHKHPDRLQTIQLSYGKAHICYPEASSNKCTVALILELNPIRLAKSFQRKKTSNFKLEQYVNDRPFSANSFLSGALSKAFSTAMNGECKNRPDLVDKLWSVEVEIATLPADNAQQIQDLFEPLGYTLETENSLLNEQFPQWGQSTYYMVKLQHEITIQALLNHLYVLIPVLDNQKHYWVGEEEVQKLLKRGKGWLATHPKCDWITKRYLKNLRSLATDALSEMGIETVTNSRKKLHNLRLLKVLEELKKSGAKRIVDLGCGEGKLLELLLAEKQVEKVLGVDVNAQELQRAKKRLWWDDLAPRQRDRIELIQGSLLYKDKRICGFDTAALVEVIEHLEPKQLETFEAILFGYAQPKTVVLTTPNSDYNELYEQLDAGTFRHDDHRFEWSRKEFEEWANNVAQEYSYQVVLKPLGEEVEGFGAPSQMAIFTQV